MGNTASDVTSGVKKQAEADSNSCKLYQLADLKGQPQNSCNYFRIFRNYFLEHVIGGGMLVELAKNASNTKNYAALDEAIKTRVEPFLYNKGEGKRVHVSKLILMRNRERPKHKHLFKNEAQFDSFQEPKDDKGQYLNIILKKHDYVLNISLVGKRRS